MTKSDWNSCTDPQPMLEFLRGKVSDRKLRLFACACCRRIWELLTDERCRQGIDAVEGYVDGKVSQERLCTAVSNAREVSARNEASLPAFAAYQTPLGTVNITGTEGDGPISTAELVAEALLMHGVETTIISGILHDIFCNPFEPVALNSFWLTPTVTSLAQAISDERAFDRMPILADALEESGCSDASILEHCRSGGEQVRGCWVVDLVLGKEGS